jgi:putative endonuclease
MNKNEIPEAGGYVYIMKSKSGALYVGSTGNLLKEHKEKLIEGSFTAKNNIDRLIYFENFAELYKARDREYQIKKWSRKKKLNLIKTKNHLMLDWAESWFED